NSLTHDNNNEVFTITQSKPKTKEEKRMDFDELLPYVGEFGLYQKILFLLMIPFASFVAWVYFTQIFITLVPGEHWCKVPGLENLTIDQR
ncbi:GSCOCG00003671001-RA-CDS, partial [Cotesia congregata]